jgi:imidazolonepropionase-like amidohydrolase
MGVEWVFRKALHDARRGVAGLPVRGADAPPAEALPVLAELLDGKIGLRVQARMQHDIFTALRLAEEFGLRIVLEEAIEAYQCLPQLKAANVPVVFGPLFIRPRGYRAGGGEANDPRLITPRALLDAGIPFALTANDLRDEDGLVRQAMIATRYGLPADAALRAVTAAPAEIMGLPEHFGTLAAGAAADLVVWSAEPFDPASRPLLVMIDGQVVYED